jgi:hypothetical protein
VPKLGYVKGQPKRFVAYHQARTRRKLPDSRHGVNSNGGKCECGCGAWAPIAKSTNRSSGAIKGERVRFLKGHNTRKSPVDYEVDPVTGCWVWQRAAVPCGTGHYGQTYVNGRKQPAHRAYYERHAGPIPEGWQVHHECVEKGFGTTLCVNPEHLKTLPVREHQRRPKVTSKLDPEAVASIKQLLREGTLSQREIAERFRVHPNHISSINTGRSWAD